MSEKKDDTHKEYEAHDTTPPPSDPGPGGGKMPPEGVGESTTRRGEDIHKEDGREFDEQGKNGADRPYGAPREGKGVDNPQESISEDMPNMPAP